jgi:ribosomal-protein-alanine N-acetyltransferase
LCARRARRNDRLDWPMTCAPTSPGRVRRFEPHRDLEALVQLIADSFGDELDAASRATLREMRRVSRPSLLWQHAGWLAWIGTPVTPGFVWEQDGRLVGNVSLRRAATAGGFFVGNLAVLPGWRRKGIGLRLMKAALDEVVKQGGRWVGLEVRVGNDPARELYERLGFREVGSTPRMVRPAGLALEPELPRSPLLRRGRGGDRRALFELLCSLVPFEQRMLLEMAPSRYDPGWERTLDHWLVGQRRSWWVVDEAGNMPGAVWALRDRGQRPNQLEVLVARDARGRFESLLVQRGLASLGRGGAKAVETVVAASSPALVGALRDAGFSEMFALVQMQLEITAGIH